MHALLEELIEHPEKFATESADKLVRPDDPETEHVTPADIRKAFLRIFDLNTFTPLGYADSGVIGLLNKRSNKKRRRRAIRKLRRAKNLTRIYAEGDSWFQHPVVPDIVDHLIRMFRGKPYLLFNSAAGGDWLLNYLYGGHYIEEISRFAPDVVLLSGGGNDILGEQKIAQLVSTSAPLKAELGEPTEEGKTDAEKLAAIPMIAKLIDTSAITQADAPRLVRGFSYMTREFFSAIWLMETAYKLLLKNIRRKFDALTILTHGYDYVVPSKKRAMLRPWRGVVNLLMNNGQWLLDPLLMRNITDPHAQRDILFTFIYCFNAMLVRVSGHPSLGVNVFHVDVRGTAKKSADWFDEIHLSGPAFRRAARAFYAHIVRQRGTKYR